jgi:hypothetical protein
MDKSLVERLKYQNLQESNIDGRTVFKTILRVIDKGAISGAEAGLRIRGSQSMVILD